MKSLILQEAINYAILRGVLFVDLFQRPPFWRHVVCVMCWCLDGYAPREMSRVVGICKNNLETTMFFFFLYSFSS